MEIGNRDRTVIVSMLAGLGHRLRHLLRAAGLAKSTYYHLLSHPAAVTRPDIEPMVAEIFARTPNGCGHRQIRMCLVHEFGVRVSHKSVLKVMRRMGLECRIRRPNPYRKYSSYRDETGARVENLLNRDFTADRPWVKLGTDCISSSRCFVFSHVFFSGWGWCRFVGLVVDSITTNHATRPSSRRRSMMLMPNSVLIRLSRYQTM